MKRNMINTGLALMAFALAVGLSGCGRSKQIASIALDEARLNISAAKSAGAQAYAAEPLKEAEAALKKAERAFAALHYDMARTEAQNAVQLAAAAQVVAEKRAAEKKLKASKKTAAVVRKTVKR